MNKNKGADLIMHLHLDELHYNNAEKGFLHFNGE